jgi:CheY-like chemotaxis protein
MGYEVIEADNGLDAVRRAHDSQPDIIVLDLELRQAADTRAIPMIAATGYSHLKQLEQARASGFDSIIVKPCEPAALVAEIERLLQRAATIPAAGAGSGQRFSQNV